MYICVFVICAVVVLHGGRVVLAWRRCDEILAVVVVVVDDACRHLWSECAVLLSQGHSQSAAGWRLTPPLTLWTCRSLRVELSNGLFPSSPVPLVAVEGKRLCAGAVKPPGPPGGSEPFFFFSGLNVSPASPWCTTAVLCYYSEPSVRRLRNRRSLETDFVPSRFSCCRKGAAVNDCVVCLCPGVEVMPRHSLITMHHWRAPLAPQTTELM